ncbi:MAG: HAD-IIB family hydrolase [Clostridium sp.]|nr:HAD-IIB family hydrolase [Clostridium sp.]MCM1547127.1 HAD-IIB family hydrolase [Ruminococcus sp.]
MNKKCIFLDIDGTVRDPFYGVPDSAWKAISAAEKNGHLAVVCTGRPIGLIPDDFPLNKFDGVIAGGGCYIEINGIVLLDEEIRADTVKKCSSILHESGILHRIETKNTIYIEPEMTDMLGFLGEKTNNSNSEIKQMIARQNKFDFRHTIDEFLKNPEPAVKFCTVSDNDKLQYINKIFGGEFNVIAHFNDDNTVNTEIVQSGFDKGSAVKIFCRELGVDFEDTVAFGDSMNDIDMFNAVKITAAMKNGEPLLCEKADIICDDIMKDGLYDGFVKAGLI